MSEAGMAPIYKIGATIASLPLNRQCRLKAVSRIAVMFVVLAIAGCTSSGDFVKPELSGEAIPHAMVARHLLPAGSVRLAAGTSLDTVLSGYLGVPNGQGEAGCTARWGRTPCLSGVAVPSNSYLILIFEPHDCNWVGRVSSAHRSGAVLLVGVEVATNSCGPGARTVATPTLSLLAVSISAGPLSTASVVYGGGLSSDNQSSPIRVRGDQVS